MLLQVPYSLDEIVATTQFLIRRRRAGQSALRVFFVGDTDEWADSQPVRDVEAHGLASAPLAVSGEGSPRRGGLRRRVEEAEAEVRRLSEAVAGLQAARVSDMPPSGSGPAPLPAGAGFREQMEEAARQAITRALAQAGSLRAAASLLGLSRQGLWLQCKRLGLKRAFQREAPSAGQQEGERSGRTRADSRKKRVKL